MFFGQTTPAHAGGDIEEVDLAALLSTPEEVWTATKTEQKNYEAPAIITTVTREQIGVWGYRSISEVLSHLLGFYVVDDHTSPNLAVRGISGGLYADSSIVKVLIDGHSVAFHSTGGNWLGPELVPLSAVERIEVVRGPASALFGADAFLGVINIKTRSGKSLSGATAWLAARPRRHQAGHRHRRLGRVREGRLRRRGGGPPDQPGPLRPHPPRQLAGPLGALDGGDEPLTARGPGPGLHLGARPGHLPAADGDRAGRVRLLLVDGPGRGVRLAVPARQQPGLAVADAGRPVPRADPEPNLRLSFKGSVFRGGPGDDNRLEVGSEFYYVRRQFGFRGGDLDGQVEWTPALGRARLGAAGGGRQRLPRRRAAPLARRHLQAGHRAAAPARARSSTPSPSTRGARASSTRAPTCRACGRPSRTG